MCSVRSCHFIGSCVSYRSGRLLKGEGNEEVGEEGAGNSEVEGLDERLELLLLGTRLVRDGTLGSI